MFYYGNGKRELDPEAWIRDIWIASKAKRTDRIEELFDYYGRNVDQDDFWEGIVYVAITNTSTAEEYAAKDESLKDVTLEDIIQTTKCIYSFIYDLKEKNTTKLNDQEYDVEDRNYASKQLMAIREWERIVSRYSGYTTIEGILALDENDRIDSLREDIDGCPGFDADAADVILKNCREQNFQEETDFTEEDMKEVESALRTAISSFREGCDLARQEAEDNCTASEMCDIVEEIDQWERNN